MIQSDAAHSTGASATTPAAITSCRRVKAGASQSQYTPANTHASGRNSPARVSSPSTGSPRRGRSSSSSAAQNTSSRNGMSTTARMA